MRGAETGRSRDVSRAVRRRLRATSAALLLGALLGLVVIGTAQRVHRPTPAGHRVATLALASDDAGTAMFDATRLAPGRRVRNCIEVEATDLEGWQRLTVTAERVTGALAGHLRVVVEQGTGGRFGDCGGFAGTTIFSGSLVDLGAGRFGADEATPAGPVSYRVTAEVASDSAPQGAAATADLTWTVESVPPAPSPDPSPTPTSSPIPSPTETAVPEPTVSPSPPASPNPTARPAPTAAPTATGTTTSDSGSADEVPTADETATDQPDVGAPAPPPAGGPDGGEVVADDAASSEAGGSDARRRMHERIATMLVELARQSRFPAVLLVALLLFLALQDRLDRRDPKLALAPMHPEPDVPFDGDEEVAHAADMIPDHALDGGGP